MTGGAEGAGAARSARGTATSRAIEHMPAVRQLVCVSANAAIDKTVAVDRLVPGAIHRPEVLATVPGGKALNVARVAVRLGLPATVVAVLGGHAGRWIAEELARRELAVIAVEAAGESRTCTSVLDRETGLLTELYEPGVTLDEACWRALEEAVRDQVTAAGPGTLAVLSGSLPPGAPDDGYRRLAEVAASAGASAAVDAGGPSLRAALPARPWLVKVNAAEAGAATMTDTRDEDGCRRAAEVLLDAGVAVALLTRGVGGALLSTPAGTWRVGAAPARGDFAVGSGDAFLAGFAAALAHGLSLPEAARAGAAVAAAHALVPGQGDVDPGVAERLLPAIEAERLG